MHRAGTSLAILLGLALALSTASRANDTMAVVGAGGLQFEQTDKIRMEREELYLSPREVRVSYIFRNLTDEDVRGRVAFPMPVIDTTQMDHTPHKFNKSARDGDIFDFHVTVNGSPISAEYDARAYIKDKKGEEKDVTDVLKKHGLSLIDPSEGKLDASAMKELLDAGIFVDDHGDDLNHPAWDVKATYHWTQAFPARRETRITHRYKPVLGGTSHSVGVDIDLKDPADYMRKWCPDEAFARAVKKLPADVPQNTVLLYWLEYILKTGANWAGPIGRFRLEIDKAGADLVSLCPIPGLKLQRRGQSFVAEATNYTPTTDIKALFVYRACDKAPCKTDDWPGLPR